MKGGDNSIKKFNYVRGTVVLRNVGTSYTICRICSLEDRLPHKWFLPSHQYFIGYGLRPK